MLALVEGLVGLGCRVVFVPDGGVATQPYTGRLQGLGVEVLVGGIDMRARLMGARRRASARGHRWVSRGRASTGSATLSPARLSVSQRRADSIEGVEFYPYDILANVVHLDSLLAGEQRDLDRMADGMPVADIGAADGDLAFTLEAVLGWEMDIIDTAATNHNGLRGAHALRDALGSTSGDPRHRPGPRLPPSARALRAGADAGHPLPPAEPLNVLRASRRAVGALHHQHPCCPVRGAGADGHRGPPGRLPGRADRAERRPHQLLDPVPGRARAARAAGRVGGRGAVQRGGHDGLGPRVGRARRTLLHAAALPRRAGGAAPARARRRAGSGAPPCATASAAGRRRRSRAPCPRAS